MQREREVGDTSQYWFRANRALIAKSLAELCYEQALRERDRGRGEFVVALGGVEYSFRARRTVWDWLHIEMASLNRECGGRQSPAGDAAQFFIDAAQALQLDACTLGNLLHETANTLAADTALLKARQDLDAQALARMPDEQLQCLLDGHPKAIVNKGRIGWGADEFAHYGTESARGVQLLWLAVEKELAVSGNGDDWPWRRLLGESLDEAEWQKLEQSCRRRGIDWSRHLPLPVHPWQWQRHIRQHYAGEIARGQIICLGALGDSYLPQVSLRTLSNRARPAALHLKLPLTVLNTSCYRGIPGRYIASGPGLSAWMQQLCERDPELRARGTDVLQEVAGVQVPHRHHEQVEGTPYRYREMLGATWRQSPAGKCAPGERHLLMAALLQSDDSGKPVAAALVEFSGLEMEQWLASLFEATVVPLYHLLCRYGVGLVAHAQNLTLVLRDDIPRRVLLKDFQGDLRLAEGDFPERGDLPRDAERATGHLPPEYIVHDLFTGHFVTVLRYLSAQLLAATGLPERRFYGVLAEVLRRYQARHPELAARFETFDLFRPGIERVCINRVRLRQGYEDSAERPVPIVDGQLRNPLWLAEQEHSSTETTLPEAAS